jgi:hypothetical protein
MHSSKIQCLDHNSCDPNLWSRLKKSNHVDDFIVMCYVRIILVIDTPTCSLLCGSRLLEMFPNYGMDRVRHQDARVTMYHIYFAFRSMKMKGKVNIDNKNILM